MQTLTQLLIFAEHPLVKKPLLQKLDPKTRLAILMAMLALILIGMFLVALVMLGSHWVRKQKISRQKDLKKEETLQNKSPHPFAQTELLVGNTDETLLSNSSSTDTQTD